MATEPKTTGLTYDDLQNFPDDNLRREIIDGDLLVTAAPGRRHQRAVLTLANSFLVYCREHGGEVYPAPTDVFFSNKNVVEPDVLVLRPDNANKLRDDRFVDVRPDLVVEVSSPSTKATDLTKKKDLYERYGITEYWFVDLDADRFEIYRLSEGRYGAPIIVSRGETVEPPTLPGLSVPVDDILGPPDQP